MNAIDSMLRDVENAIRSRNDRIYEINQQLCTYEDNIEQLRIKKEEWRVSNGTVQFKV